MSPSPENLLLSSLSQCVQTTFEAFCIRDGIELFACNTSAKGTVERSKHGLIFSSIVVSIDIEAGHNAERVELTLEDAKRQCLIINSLSVPVVVETMIRVSHVRLAA